MPDFYIGRQPIFNSRLEVKAYELLYRSGNEASARLTDGDQATSTVIVNSVLELGLERLVGSELAFINLTRNFILNSDWLPPIGDGVVLEVLEDITVDGPLLAALRQLRTLGYGIALDDFEYRDGLKPLVQMADYIKLDIRAHSEANLRAQVEHLKAFGVTLLAEKVETREEFEFCRELGFELFQGFFLAKPANVQGKRLPANKLNVLSLLTELQAPDASVSQLESIIVGDVSLSYRLLRYMNSAAFLERQSINSIRHAIVYLGIRAIKNWASLIALASLDDQPTALIGAALVRAKMCEQLANAFGVQDRESAFTVGMFSMLDALMGAPLEELLTRIPLADNLKQALLSGEGEFGELVSLCVAYEHGNWAQLADTRLETETLSEIYLTAVDWAGRLSGQLQQSATQSVSARA